MNSMRLSIPYQILHKDSSLLLLLDILFSVSSKINHNFMHPCQYFFSMFINIKVPVSDFLLPMLFKHFFSLKQRKYICCNIQMVQCIISSSVVQKLYGISLMCYNELLAC